MSPPSASANGSSSVRIVPGFEWNEVEGVWWVHDATNYAYLERFQRQARLRAEILPPRSYAFPTLLMKLVVKDLRYQYECLTAGFPGSIQDDLITNGLVEVHVRRSSIDPAAPRFIMRVSNEAISVVGKLRALCRSHLNDWRHSYS